jgi:hypothetical protein
MADELNTKKLIDYFLSPDIDGTPLLAALISLGLASAVQGSKADTAVQPGAPLLEALDAIGALFPTTPGPSGYPRFFLNGGVVMFGEEE